MTDKYQYDFYNRDGLLNKLRAYAVNPDDDNIRIKNEIHDCFIHSPELLYALNDKELEKELFDENGNLNVDQNGEPLGEWDRYFGSNSLIRPFLFVPDTQTEVKNYICYQTSTDDLVRYNNNEKYMIITFTIFVHGKNRMDEETGIPRHDLIASIIREKFAWIGLEISTTIPDSDKEAITDNNYLVRTVRYQTILPNSLVKTEGENTFYKNKRW